MKYLIYTWVIADLNINFLSKGPGFISQKFWIFFFSISVFDAKYKNHRAKKGYLVAHQKNIYIYIYKYIHYLPASETEKERNMVYHI